uniref:TNF receptor-associated factor 6-like n=1 Tax=Styela clava TaxID=7725 RepID=UPI00193A532F|nr:TNF receptor-associated factor 6-like [Styela clava]
MLSSTNGAVDHSVKGSVSTMNDNSELLELGGYDYEFVPSLDNKHMCPICFNALREPVQTECGHRFCHTCILRSVARFKKCPVDNVPLLPSQLFQDKCALREVLDLRAKCNNKGCDHVCELRLMETQHKEICVMRKYPCKNNCGLSLLKQDAIYHEENQCPRRPVTCDVCGQTYPLATEEAHREDCKQHLPVNCPHCSHELKQYKLQYHITTECMKAPIKCVFSKVGCERELPRHDIQQHMEKSTQIHLQYLLNNISSITKDGAELSAMLKSLTSRITRLEKDDYPYDTNDSHIEIYGRDDDGVSNGPGNMPGLRSRVPHQSSPRDADEVDEIALIKEFNHMMENNHSAVSEAGPSHVPLRSESLLREESMIGKDAEKKIISLDHHVRELKAKMDTQITSVKELTSKMTYMEQRLQQQELRLCNGLYYWKIKDYSRLRAAAAAGEVTVLHSPGFYTSPHGYRICVRVNLDGVETAQGTHLSLFVHLMKGDNDDLLSWPFSGVITLTVMNQMDRPQDRSHISETLQAKTNLMAFQRPVSERNQKGYGYIDFFPLKMIESEGFIKNDTLIIKAQVRVDAPISN